MVKLVQNSLGLLWDHLEKSVQDVLFGIFICHGIISTRKALASLAQLNSSVTQTFDNMKRSGVTVPFDDQIAAPNSNWQRHEVDNMQCSPCVENACIKLLNNHEGGKISVLQFLSTLVMVSRGPIIQQWSQEGYSSHRIIEGFHSEGVFNFD